MTLMLSTMWIFLTISPYAVYLHLRLAAGQRGLHAEGRLVLREGAALSHQPLRNYLHYVSTNFCQRKLHKYWFEIVMCQIYCGDITWGVCHIWKKLFRRNLDHGIWLWPPLPWAGLEPPSSSLCCCGAVAAPPAILQLRRPVGGSIS